MSTPSTVTTRRPDRAEPPEPRAGRISPTLWRIAGGLALAHVVLLFAGFSQERSTVLGASPREARSAWVEWSLSRAMFGGYIESLSFVVLLPALVFVARAIGRRTEAARWAGQTALAAGVAYVVVTLATGMPAGAAAAYDGHRGLDIHTALAIVDIRNFAFFLSLLVLGAQAIGLGVAAYLDGFSRRWVGIGGMLVGVFLLAGVAMAGKGLHDYASMAWMVWWVGVGVQLIRKASVAAADARP